MSIINEVKQIENILNKNNIDKIDFKDVYMLCKYWRFKEKKKDQCRKDIFDYMNNKVLSFNEVIYYEKIEKILNTVYRMKEKNLNLVYVENIKFYKSEMDFIEFNIKKKSAKRIFFIMLFFAKLKKEMYNIDKDEVWLNDDIRKYCRLAKVNEKLEKKMLYISHLVDVNAIAMSNSITDVTYKINLNKIKEIEDSKVVISIDKLIDEKELILYYKKYKGEKIIRCEICGELRQFSKYHSKEYLCKKCSKIKSNENNNKRVKKHNKTKY